MGAPDPAVDAQRSNAVGLAAQHALALGRQTQREAGEEAPVAERRGDRELLSVLCLDEPDAPAADPASAR